MTDVLVELAHGKVTVGAKRFMKVKVELGADRLRVWSLRGGELLAEFAGPVTVVDSQHWTLQDSEAGLVEVGDESCGCGGTRVEVLVGGRWMTELRARRQGLL